MGRPTTLQVGESTPRSLGGEGGSKWAWFMRDFSHAPHEAAHLPVIRVGVVGGGERLEHRLGQEDIRCEDHT